MFNQEVTQGYTEGTKNNGEKITATNELNEVRNDVVIEAAKAYVQKSLEEQNKPQLDTIGTVYREGDETYTKAFMELIKPEHTQDHPNNSNLKPEDLECIVVLTIVTEGFQGKKALVAVNKNNEVVAFAD